MQLVGHHLARRRTAILGPGFEYYYCLAHAHTARHELGDAIPIKFANASTTVTVIDYDGTCIEYELGFPTGQRSWTSGFFGPCFPRDELVKWRFHGVRTSCHSLVGTLRGSRAPRNHGLRLRAG